MGREGQGEPRRGGRGRVERAGTEDEGDRRGCLVCGGECHAQELALDFLFFFVYRHQAKLATFDNVHNVT